MSATDGRLPLTNYRVYPFFLTDAQKVDDQHLIAFREMFLSLEVGSQHKIKYDDLALSDYDIFSLLSYF
jgi:hypothetical protein